MNEREVKEIIKLLKTKDLDLRPALQQVFENKGILWATDGYVVFEICEVGDNLKNKCATLHDLRRWLVDHPKGTMFDDFRELEDQVPDIDILVHYGDYIDVQTSPKLDIKKLKQCCDFLYCTMFTIKVNSENPNLYQIIPINSKMNSLELAMDSKAYMMGLRG